jgi:hypothetical protein
MFSNSRENIFIATRLLDLVKIPSLFDRNRLTEDTIIPNKDFLITERNS